MVLCQSSVRMVRWVCKYLLGIVSEQCKNTSPYTLSILITFSLTLSDAFWRFITFVLLCLTVWQTQTAFFHFNSFCILLILMDIFSYCWLVNLDSVLIFILMSQIQFQFVWATIRLVWRYGTSKYSISPFSLSIAMLLIYYSNIFSDKVSLSFIICSTFPIIILNLYLTVYPSEFKIVNNINFRKHFIRILGN